MAQHTTIIEEIMSDRVATIKESDTLQTAAKRLAENNVGALPICDDKNRVLGILTDRDIVVHGLANDCDPKTATVRDIATIEPVTVERGMPAARALELMARYQVRRLPVVENDVLVGIVSQADIARSASPAQTGDLLTAISTE